MAKGHVGIIVEKVYKETSSDIYLVCITDPSQCYMNSECVLESRDTPTAGNNLIPISVPLQCSCEGYVYILYMYLVTSLALDSLILADC